MKRHRLVLRASDQEIFDQIKSGEKSIETRAATTRYAKIQAGDELEFVCGQDKVIKAILAVVRYDTVESIFQSADWSRVMPGVDSLDEAKRIYYSYPGYEDKIDRHGLIALYLQ